MDDEMIDLMAGDAMLRRRLEAYAETRLSPDLVASSRMRARVLAVAHRQAHLAHADTALTVLPGSRLRSTGVDVRRSTVTRTRRTAWRRTTTALLAASLGIVLMTGTVVAARPGGGLYDARLWLETITLPSDPSARAVAELGRLAERIREARGAARAGDPAAAAAALVAYWQIVDAASAAAITSHDPVAAAAFEAGVGRNILVLRELIGHVPTQAQGAIRQAIDRAVERSGAAIDAIDTTNDDPGDNGNPGNGGNPGTNPDTEPADRTASPTGTPKPTPTVKPTKPAATPKATNDGGPDKPAKPDPTPGKTPPAHGS